MSRFVRFIVLLSLFCMIFSSQTVLAGGKLDTFEKNVEKKDTTPPGRCDYCDGTANSTTSAIANSWWEMLSLFMMSGLNLSMPQGSTYGDYHRALKASGSALLPTIKFEGNYQYVVSDINGYDMTGTLGFLMIGADCNIWHLFEKSPTDQLKFISPHVLFRMAPFPFMEIDLALGDKMMIGNNTHQGFEAGFPAYFFFGKYFSWDIKTYVSYIEQKAFWDVSSGLNLRFKYVGLRAGYRMIKIPGDSIHGPQAGMFAQW